MLEAATRGQRTEGAVLKDPRRCLLANIDGPTSDGSLELRLQKLFWVRFVHEAAGLGRVGRVHLLVFLVGLLGNQLGLGKL